MSNPDQEKSVSKQGRVIKRRSKIKKINAMNANVENKIKIKRRKFQHKAAPAIYIGHIPHGFYEDEMSAYFNQFGKVQSAVVVRSKKTGRSKGYGFVEFENEEVAKIAAETMNNYLIFNRVLKCKYIPPEEGKRRKPVETVYPILPKVRNRVTDFRNKMKAFKALDQNSYQKKAQKKINNLKKFFEEKGMDFSFKVNFLEDDKN